MSDRAAVSTDPGNLVPDLAAPAFLADPFACYRQWRRVAPVHYVPRQHVWLILDYDAVTTVLKDTTGFSSSPYRRENTQLLGADPPAHGPVRRRLAGHFGRAHADEQRVLAADETRRRLSLVDRQPSFDLAADFIHPLVEAVNCRWLGVHQDQLGDLLHGLHHDPQWDRFRRALTGDGLLPTLIASGDWSQPDLMDICRFLFLAGVTTTRDFLGNSIYCLFDEPGLMTTLRTDPSLIPALVNEVLRYQPPAHLLFRQTTMPVDVTGVAIPEGALVYVAIAAANRDPARFDDPDRLILTRPPSPRALSFGTGPHVCIGQDAARAQSEDVLRVLLTEWPLLEVRQRLSSVEFTGAPVLRGPKALAVGFSSAAPVERGQP